MTGGRDFVNAARLAEVLDGVHVDRGIDLVIQGGARGADRLAYNWAMAAGVQTATYDANWARHHKAAGPLRNIAMLKHSAPDIVIAFPGHRGTNDMIERVVTAGDIELYIAR